MVDALHISRIEIREAEAPEISKYMNEKVRPQSRKRRGLTAAHGETYSPHGGRDRGFP